MIVQRRVSVGNYYIAPILVSDWFCPQRWGSVIREEATGSCLAFTRRILIHSPLLSYSLHHLRTQCFPLQDTVMTSPGKDKEAITRHWICKNLRIGLPTQSQEQSIPVICKLPDLRWFCYISSRRLKALRIRSNALNCVLALLVLLFILFSL